MTECKLIDEFNLISVSKRSGNKNATTFHVENVQDLEEYFFFYNCCSSSSNVSCWHLDIVGKIWLHEVEVEIGGVKLSKKFVNYSGQFFEVKYLRRGLDQECLVFGVDVKGFDGEYDIWELYTDTPANIEATRSSIKEKALKSNSSKGMCF